MSREQHEDWTPAERWNPEWRNEEQPTLEEEARRLAELYRDYSARHEAVERRLRARLAGYRPIDEVIEHVESRNGNGLPYPRAWYELANRARDGSNPDRQGPHFDGRGRPHDD